MLVLHSGQLSSENTEQQEHWRKARVCSVYDDEPTEEQPAPVPPAHAQPGGASGPAAPAASGAAPPDAAGRSRRPRAGAAGAAMTSRTAGWMVAAALGGSMLTLLLTGQLHSAQVTYVRAAAAQRPARLSHSAAAVPGRVAVQRPASARARQAPAPPGPGKVVYGRGQMSVPLPPRTYIKATPGQGQVVYGPGQVTVPLPPRAYIKAGPGRVQVVVPPGAIRRQLRVLPPRAYIRAIPGPPRAVLPPRAALRRLRALPPLAACRLAGPPAGVTRIIGVRPGRRLVIVRGRPAAGARVSRVPGQVRVWVGPGRRVTVRGKPVPAGRSVVELPAPRPGGPFWAGSRIVIVRGRRVMAGAIPSGGPWTARPACIVSPPRTPGR